MPASHSVTQTLVRRERPLYLYDIHDVTEARAWLSFVGGTSVHVLGSTRDDAKHHNVCDGQRVWGSRTRRERASRRVVPDDVLRESAAARLHHIPCTVESRASLLRCIQALTCATDRQCMCLPNLATYCVKPGTSRGVCAASLLASN
jgi:hypothetical protein